MAKVVDVDIRRSEFIEAGWDLVAAEGLEAVSLRRAASQAGYTTGALTHYFPRREALLSAMLQAAYTAAAGRMRIAARDAPTRRARLPAVLAQALPLDAERLREWRVWLAFWAAAAGDPALAAENRLRYGAWRATVDRCLVPWIADPRRRASEANDLMALVDGLGLAVIRDAEGRDPAVQAAGCNAAMDRYLERLEARFS
jgi:AcrR family transcriptional regulator